MFIVEFLLSFIFGAKEGGRKTKGKITAKIVLKKLFERDMNDLDLGKIKLLHFYADGKICWARR